MADLQLQIQRCIEEQNAAAVYLRSDGSNKKGALLWVSDWLMEEVILRLEMKDGNSKAKASE